MELKSISYISGVIDDGMVDGIVVVIFVIRFATLVILVICLTNIL